GSRAQAGGHLHSNPRELTDYLPRRDGRYPTSGSLRSWKPGGRTAVACHVAARLPLTTRFSPGLTSSAAVMASSRAIAALRVFRPHAVAASAAVTPLDV